jgi:hypothetical protein
MAKIRAEMAEREQESRAQIAETFKLAGLLLEKLDHGRMDDFLDTMREVNPSDLIEVTLKFRGKGVTRQRL